MNTTLTQYETAERALRAIVDAVPERAWTNPSPCDGWAARDVVRHMIETQRDFLAGHDVDLGSPPDVDLDPAAAWHDHVKRVTEALADDALGGTRYDGHFGPTTVGETLVQFYVWDMVVHRWDVARSAGLDPRLSEAELEQIDLGANSFGDALYLDGVCRPGVEAPADADRTARVLARLGRTM